MKLQGLLFDIDGTLVDSNDYHARCWIEAFAHYGKHFEYGVIRHQLGKGGDLLVPDVLNAKEMREFGDAVKKYRSKLYKEKYLKDVKPFPFVERLFEALRAKKIKIALASSSNEEEVEYYTRLLNAEEFIEGSTSKSDAKFSKPSPEIFEAALDRAGSDPKFTFAVGDTPYDILAAHRIAMPIVAVLSGGFERQLLAKSELVLNDAGDIPGNFDDIEAWFE
ncbi:MAG TPA: HAD family phosphatase [Thermoanaerobaculia bacterium]|nr:HAD family phosphatase [Thermoanaerobaculia bacterium]